MNSKLPASMGLSLEGFSRRGGETAEHGDGWGAAFFDTEQGQPGRTARLFVEREGAARSLVARSLHECPIACHNAIAHVRKATIGPVAVENSHPFERALWGRCWIFAHNGHLKDFAPALDGSFEPDGATDSERAFCSIMQALASRFPELPSLHELTVALAEISAEVASHGPFNFILSNGQAMWARASTNLCYVARAFPFGVVSMTDLGLEADLDALHGPDDRLCIVATEPLTSNEAWSRIAPGQLAMFVGGELAQMIFLPEGSARSAQ